jgi:hypothetical protein
MCDGHACRPFLFLPRSIGLAEHRLRRWHRGSTRKTGSIRANSQYGVTGAYALTVG